MGKIGNKNAVGNRGGGRKSSYKPEYARIAKAMAELGATDIQIAKALGKSERTIMGWKKKFPEFSAALKEGKVFPDQNVVASLYRRAIGSSHPEDKIFNDNGKALIVPTIKYYPPDTTACIYWLKNRLPDKWRDRPSPGDDEEVPKSVKIEFVVEDARRNKTN